MMATDCETGDERRYVKGVCALVMNERNVMSARLFGASLSGVGVMLRLERDDWSMVKWPRQEKNEYTPRLPRKPLFRGCVRYPQRQQLHDPPRETIIWPHVME